MCGFSINSFSVLRAPEILPVPMTFLPILERELRVRARNPASYWARFGMAAVGLLVCAPTLMLSGPFTAPGTSGRGAFHGLVSAAFLLCCAACIFTADTISSERREGTLGLLLLTRVRNFDVLLGKFASSGLASLAALVAFLPVLALPILSGGVTGGEAVRNAVALFDTLFLALSVGLWASARGFERFRTARAAFLTLAGLVLGPPLLGLFVQNTHVALASPLGTLYRASDTEYKLSAATYWVSLGLVQIAGWTFLLSAVASMRGRPEEVKGPVHEPARGVRANSPVTRTTSTQATNTVVADSNTMSAVVMCRYCGRANNADATCCRECGTVLRPIEPTPSRRLLSGPTPLHWLLRRQRGFKPMLWLAGIIGFFHFALFGMVGRFLGGAGMLFFGISSASGLAMSVITGSIFAWAASRFFVEARRTGELELLLTTPLGATQLVSTQWDILQRQVRWPIAVMMLPSLLQAAFFLLPYNPIRSNLWTLYSGLSTLLTAGNVILSVAALCWLALWFGLRVAGQGKAILWTVLLANGVPYVMSLVWSIVYQPVIRFVGGASGGFGTPWLLGYLIPQMVILLFYLWLIRLARWHLLRELAGGEPLDPRQIFSFSNLLPRMAAAIRRVRQWPGV
jgi:ribosomal protein L40E